MPFLTIKAPGILGGSSPASRRKAGEAVSARLAAHPGVEQAKVAGADVFYHLDFLDDAECARLIALIDANRRPSTLLADRSGPDFRTSESCDLDRWAPDVLPIDTRIADLLGVAPEQGETLQGQRYAPGQQFRAHHDYFHESESYWPAMKAQGGQRTWTAMAYLNDVEEGGATWFPQLGIRIAPRKGMLLLWNNMAADGNANPLTLHEGMAVVTGTKYIVTKWFRENRWLK